MKKVPKIPVMELFGPTIQGEGLMSGTVTHFLRTGGCGLRCAWCDSMFAVLPKEIRKHRAMMSTADIITAINHMPYAPYITFTGGDPCLHERLGDLIPAMNSRQIRVAVETQGQVFPEWLWQCDVLTFSPKGPSSGNTVDYEKLGQQLVLYNGSTLRRNKVCIKVVCFSQDDFEYALKVYGYIPPSLYDAFYFTAGTPSPDRTPEEKVNGALSNQTAIAEHLLEHVRNVAPVNEKVHVGHQMHVIMWPGKDKGV